MRDSAAIITDALNDLLDGERELILSGRLEELGRTIEQKERLFARLATNSNPLALDSLRQKLERNQALLRAAARGLEAAKTTIARIARGGDPLRTYDADGAASELVRRAHQPLMNRRA